MRLPALVPPVVPVLSLPFTLVRNVETVVIRLAVIASRVEALLDEIAPLPGRVVDLLDVAQPTTDRVVTVVDGIEQVPEKIDALLVRAGGTTDRVVALVEDVERTLASLQPLLLQAAVLELEAVPGLLSDLGGLGPVVAELGTRVQNLDGTVADVGAMLSGIPGAARLVRRGSAHPR